MTYALADFGSYRVGGRAITIEGSPVQDVAFTPTTNFRYDPNGLHFVEHAYVQYFVPTEKRNSPPVILMHGGGMTGVTWETTPDGRPGWLHHLLARGFEVHVIDNVERGRAGWRPDFWDGEALTRSAEEAWQLFRFGTEEGYDCRTPFAAQRFPIEAFDTFCQSFVPRWFTTQKAQSAALTALVERLGQCWIIAHSQGCQTAFDALNATGPRIEQLIAIEPSGVPASLEETVQAEITIAFGDYLDCNKTWRGMVARALAFHQENEARTHWIDLTQCCGPGFSHMIMMDHGNEDALDAVLAP